MPRFCVTKMFRLRLRRWRKGSIWRIQTGFILVTGKHIFGDQNVSKYICLRRDERYLEDDDDHPANPGVKKSRFLKKERKIELSFKENVPEVVKDVVAPPRRRRKEAKELPELKEPVKEAKVQEVERNRHGITVVHWPHNPDDLVPIPRPPVKNVPQVSHTNTTQIVCK